ncbi:MAG: PPOX class F420-dependent oxidoreductase [Dehalococcoidia bacterium]
MAEISAADADRFLNEQRLAVLGTIKADGVPQLSPVYFAWDGASLYLSLTKTRAKYHNIRRDPRVSLCVLQDTPPYQSVTVYGRAEIEEEDILDKSIAVVHKFRGQVEIDRDAFLQELRRQGRVVARIIPERFVR